MKKIVCELCENTEFAKDGGMFVCQGCGTKYTPEEAKGMMKEVEGESTPAPVTSAPSVNPNQQQIENLLVLASNAFESSNNQETEGYCNKVIEMDVTCYKAWLLKGQAIGWQSTYGSPRVEEGANAMRKAVDFAPEEEKENVARQALVAIRRVCDALCSLAKENFGNSPTKDNREKFFEFAEICSNATALFDNTSPEIKQFSFEEWKAHKKLMATFMNQAGVAAIKVAREKWNNLEHPNDDSFFTYLDWFEEIENIFTNSIRNGEEVDESDENIIIRYENKIIAIEEPIDICSYKQEWNSYWSRYDWVKGKVLTDEAKKIRRKQVTECKEAIAKIKNKAKEKEEAERKAAEEAKKQRIEAYWAAHKDEKDKLESEKKELSDKKAKFDTENANLDKEIKAAEAEEKVEVPAQIEIDKLKDQKKELENRRSKLGLFAGKEKKQIGEEIAALDGRISALINKAEEERKAKKAEIDKKVAPLKAKKEENNKEYSKITKRIAAIDAELTKDPEEK